MNNVIIEMEETSWTDSRTVQFIDLFRIQECLWRIISEDHKQAFFIFPVINVTIHFDIKDRAGCRKAKEAISAGCLHQTNN